MPSKHEKTLMHRTIAADDDTVRILSKFGADPGKRENFSEGVRRAAEFIAGLDPALIARIAEIGNGDFAAGVREIDRLAREMAAQQAEYMTTPETK